MPLSTAQLAQLVSDSQTITAAVAALVPDPVPDPRDVQIAALTAEITTVKADLVQVTADLAKATKDAV